MGDFDKARTVAMVEKSYGSWKGKLTAAPIPVEPVQKAPRRAHVGWEQPTLPQLWMQWKVPGSNDLKAAATMTVLNAYLFGSTSPLFQDLMLGRALVDMLQPSWDGNRDPNLFGAIVKVKKLDDVPVVETAVLDSVAELASGKVDKARLETVRSNLKYSAAIALDKADTVAVTLAVTTALTGDLEYLNKLYTQIDKLQAADLAVFAKRVLVDAGRTTVTLSHGEGPKAPEPKVKAKVTKPVKATKGGGK